ncbi:MAG: HAMP domain-containing histidine kinase [Pseudomonadota bacterium]|nr:HAMP domain-containing histidine kinase [Pseudomonadota bacterium]
MIRGAIEADQLPAPAAPRLLNSAGWAAWGLPMLLGTLHLALAGERDAAAGALLIAHFGLFLLWQPFFSPGASVSALTVAAVIGVLAAAFYLGGNWFLVIWMCALVGLLGGRISGTAQRRNRSHLLVALFVLLALLLFRAVPAVLPGQPVPELLAHGLDFGMPLLLFAMGLIRPYPDPERAARGLDFFYSLLSFQLAMLLVLGTAAATLSSHTGYFQALLITVFAVALALLMLGLVWNPSSGFSGLRSYLSRYLLSVGVPFEAFLQDLAGRADRDSDPRTFLDSAVALLEALPWVRAAGWQSADGQGHQGEPFAGEPLRFRFHELELSLETAIPQTPAVVLHVRLLAQLIAEFHAGKCRELQLRQNAYMQAVHETGARLTHDIKNLLQSLVSLTSAGELMEDDQAGAYAAMVRRQLPVLSQRLQGTLEKLRAPASEPHAVRAPAADWWRELCARYAPRGVELDGFADVPPDLQVPRNLFDSVAENLLENALRKRGVEPGLQIRLSWLASEAGGFEVFDTGTAVPDGVVGRLFLHPTSTMKGLGIGLMQAAAQARGLGYRLALRSNRTGAVVFALLPVADLAHGVPASQLIA